jgi:hypothetical protein
MGYLGTKSIGIGFGMDFEERYESGVKDYSKFQNQLILESLKNIKIIRLWLCTKILFLTPLSYIQSTYPEAP